MTRPRSSTRPGRRVGHGDGGICIHEERGRDPVVERDGSHLVRTRGSHRHYHHPEKAGTVTLAGRMSKDLSPAMRDSIAKQVGLDTGALWWTTSWSSKRRATATARTPRPAGLRRRWRHPGGDGVPDSGG